MYNTDNISAVVLSFLSYKRTIQNCSELTVNEYYIDLRTFFRYITAIRNNDDLNNIEKVDISRINEAFCDSIRSEEIYSFLLYLANKRENKPAARARKLSAIRAFYKYHTVKSRLLKNNPVKDIETPTLKHKLPKYLSIDESIGLLNSVEKSSKTYERDYAILTLFLNCGMRLSELVNINLGDIDEKLESLIVTGKGNKQRKIYLNTACRSALQNYLNVRQVRAAEGGVKIKDKNALFISRLGTRISNKTVQWLVQKQLNSAGLKNKKYSTHKLRHTAATLMYNSGNVDILVLKNILGHEQLNTTQIYTHVSDKKMKNAMDENPLANIKESKNAKD
ncbi:MAG: hypothetical protein A2Y17_12385 [Clostridiales bacterium GWF2_38_85]|nr:MAG: hypothetical protein A2Y17_12385 [Clostridiales bacterium GWF2_38_85]HBL84056.1 recombinase XerC [Clostridiales bacterium]